MPAPVSVVCAVIHRDDRVLIAQRPVGKHLALKWEFPGGKVEPGEQPDAALVREIREELGCDIVVREKWPSFVHQYERGEIELMPFICELRPESAEPHPHEHARVSWVRVTELREFDLAEADLPVVMRLEEQTLFL